ncbi:hypothetical protein DENSPDRAFT_881864 [Dentipellis sp. KUC8613]|nr:hypothetical protein DENSPDRAFT_881864 [Dentipellis sp. KUC8613]
MHFYQSIVALTVLGLGTSSLAGPIFAREAITGAVNAAVVGATGAGKVAVGSAPVGTKSLKPQSTSAANVKLSPSSAITGKPAIPAATGTFSLVTTPLPTTTFNVPIPANFDGLGLELPATVSPGVPASVVAELDKLFPSSIGASFALMPGATGPTSVAAVGKATPVAGKAAVPVSTATAVVGKTTSVAGKTVPAVGAGLAASVV